MKLHLLPRTKLGWIAVALLALHFVLAVGSKRQESVTADELAHLTGGFSYWQFDDYRLQPENGNLPQRWAALPAYLAHWKYPPLATDPAWRHSDVWSFGYGLFYASGNDHFPALMEGRAMIALFSVATGALVFAWSRRLFGHRGAFISLLFFASSPAFLAHGALVTSDACMAFFFLAGVGLWWRHLHDGRAGTWALSVLVFGLACVAKYSVVLLVPMMGLIACVRAGHAEPLRLAGRSFTRPWSKLGAAVGSGLVHAAGAVLVIWAFFGFRYAAFNPALPPAEHFIVPFPVLVATNGWQGAVIQHLASWRLLPEAFLYGYVYVIESVKARGAFLNGEYSTAGWPTFFIWAFLLKATIPLIVGSVVAAAVWSRRSWAALARTPGPSLYAFTPLFTLFAVYWLVSLTSHLDIGDRHILPTYPVLFILLGALGPGFTLARAGRAAGIAALLAWQVGECAAIAPHFLAYFNEWAGGPAHGYQHLVDSSLDWGQDLPGLKRWLDRHAPPAEPVFLSYFGTGEPDYYAIRAERLPFINEFHHPQPYVPLRPGLYCIGASMLQQVYSSIRGPWTLEREKEFQFLKNYAPLYAAYQADPQRRAELNQQLDPARWKAASARFTDLRFARLCYYLRVRPPEATIGYSIFIYRLSAAELAAATDGTLREWEALIERTVSAKSAHP